MASDKKLVQVSSVIKNDPSVNKYLPRHCFTCCSQNYSLQPSKWKGLLPSCSHLILSMFTHPWKYWENLSELTVALITMIFSSWFLLSNSLRRISRKSVLMSRSCTSSTMTWLTPVNRVLWLHNKDTGKQHKV